MGRLFMKIVLIVKDTNQGIQVVLITVINIWVFLL